MRRFISVCLICVGSFSISNAVGDDNPLTAPVAVKAADIYRPTAMPDRIVLSWAGDPTTTQAVNWRTSIDVSKGYAEIAEAEAGPLFREHAKKSKATRELLKTDINTAHFHSVQFTGLKPATKYVYRVGDGVNWSEWFHFNTASAAEKPFEFIYLGDAQNDIRSLWSRVIREAYGDAPKAAFMLHAGDLVNNAEVDAEWGEWFGAGAWLTAMVPTVAIPGNHEQAKAEDGSRRLSHHWRPQFVFPENGPKGLEESCFTFTYQDTRFVCLNSNEQQEIQATWLDKVLAENKSKWVICSFHHPIYSTAKDRDNAALRGLWKPIIDRHKVDLVLQGHDHTYGRTGFDVPENFTAKKAKEVINAAGQSAVQPLATAQVGTSVVAQTTASAAHVPSTLANVATGAQVIEPSNGTIYVVSVSGPKMYNISRHPFMKRVAEDTQLYQVIRIDGDKLHFEARTAVGQLYDAFELHKRSGARNELVEIAPEVPEHTRREVQPE